VYFDGTKLNSTSSPVVGYITATSTTDSSVFMGNVGIGGGTPQQKLTINNGNIFLINGGDGIYLAEHLLGDESGLYSGNGDQQIATFDSVLNLYNYANGYIQYDGATNYVKFNQSSNLIWNENDDDTTANFGDLVIVDDPNDYVLLDGYVGIGTVTPLNVLHVNSGPYEHQLTLSGPANATGETAGLEFKYAGGIVGGNIARILGYTQTGGGGDILFQTAANGSAAYTSQMTLSRGGNVGIGTTTPLSKLSIQTGSTNASASNWYDNNAKLMGQLFVTGGAPNNAGALRLYNTAGTETIRISGYNETSYINTGGNLGIGTTTPDNLLYLLKVNGAGDVGITIQNYATTDGETASLKFRNTTSATDFSVIESLRVDGNEADLNFKTLQGGTLGTVMTLDSAGNVGVGTTNPQYKLDIQGSSPYLNLDSSQSSYAILDRGDSVNYEAGYILRTAGTNAGFLALDAGSDNLRILRGTSISGTSGITLDASGNVGIGTTNPSRLLTLAGGDASSNVLMAIKNTSDTDKTFFGIVGTAGSFIDNGAVGDTFLRAQQDLVLTSGVGGDVDESIWLKATTGNVGVGINNPTTKLHISSSGTTVAALDSATKFLVDNTGSGVVAQFNGAGAAGEESLIGFSYRQGASVPPVSLGYVVDSDGWTGVSKGALVFKTRAVTTATAPTERLRITSGGNIGINNSNPQALLSLGNGVATNKFLIYDNNNTSKFGFGLGSGQFQMYAGGDNNTNRIAFGKYDGTTFTENVSFLNNGNVGIGTTTANNPLTVFSNNSRVQLGNIGSTYGAIGFNSAALSNTNYSLTGEGSNTYLNTPSGGFMAFRVNNTDKMRIDSSGNVGVGITNPAAKLDVYTLNGDAPVGGLIGIKNYTENTGDPSDIYGIKSTAKNSYSASNVYGVYGEVLEGGQTQNYYGVYGTSNAQGGNGVAGVVSGGVGVLANGGTGTGLLALGSTWAIQATGKGYFSDKVAIGTSTPVSTLSVQGSLCVRNTGSCGTTAGTIYATTQTTVDIDLAENYQAFEDGLEPGDLVYVDKENVSSSTSTMTESFGLRLADKTKMGYLIGVISTKPGVVLGNDVIDGKPVALAGRVPVKISNENGHIKIGDYISISSIAGVGMKATSSGVMIGQALEDFSDQSDYEIVETDDGQEFRSGKITVFINLGYARLTPQIKDGEINYVDQDIWTVDAFTGQIKPLTSLDLNNFDIENIKSLRSFSGNWSLDENGVLVTKEIRTEKLCLEDICIDRSILSNIIDQLGLTVDAVDSGNDQTDGDDGGEVPEEDTTSSSTDDQNNVSELLPPSTDQVELDSPDLIDQTEEDLPSSESDETGQSGNLDSNSGTDSSLVE